MPTHLVQEAHEVAEDGVVVFWKALQDLAAACHPQAALHTYNGRGFFLSPSRGGGMDAGRRTALRTDRPDIGPGDLPYSRTMELLPAKPSVPRAPVPSLHPSCNCDLPNHSLHTREWSRPAVSKL